MLVQNYKKIAVGADLNDIKTPGVYILNAEDSTLKNSPIPQTNIGSFINYTGKYTFILTVKVLRDSGYENGLHLSQEIEATYFHYMKYRRIYINNSNMTEVINNDGWTAWEYIPTGNSMMYSFNKSVFPNTTNLTFDFNKITSSCVVDIVCDNILNSPYGNRTTMTGFLLVIGRVYGTYTDESDVSEHMNLIQIWFGRIHNNDQIKYREKWYMLDWTDWKPLIV